MSYEAPTSLYFAAIGIAAAVSAAVTPVVRQLAMRFGWLDRPSSAVKTHKVATPCLGGVGIWIGFAVSLLVIRWMTTFPSGTLRSLRAVLFGSLVVFILGVIDDLDKPVGLHFRTKFAGQLAAAGLLVYFGIRIAFVAPDYVAVGLTLFWVVGITNAFNIIDIMDGLSATQGIMAAAGFLLISLPSEQIYVNFASASLLGAALGYLPWNFSSQSKIFMGDSGSMTLGFVLSAVALGIDYSQVNPLGVYAPLFILMIPMYDTFYVMAMRMRRGLSPFRGSKDHFALRLERLGFSRDQIVILASLAAGLLSVCAFIVTRVSWVWSFWIYAVLLAEIALLTRAISRIEME
ncbi:MAG: undecaprenyl/decaprenyl-phosphate alpha-N-acetylglucosaminyl 1-phosphate transferase [Elusimicrobia bacterium]|nr:undecaprenyl/decaprenyl-phosphate alpha-N-acetylglucosaminyl 1-phosphate transferase [Elusimicrobiota bacterium]